MRLIFHSFGPDRFASRLTGRPLLRRCWRFTRALALLLAVLGEFVAPIVVLGALGKMGAILASHWAGWSRSITSAAVALLAAFTFLLLLLALRRVQRWWRLGAIDLETALISTGWALGLVLALSQLMRWF